MQNKDTIIETIAETLGSKVVYDCCASGNAVIVCPKSVDYEQLSYSKYNKLIIIDKVYEIPVCGIVPKTGILFAVKTYDDRIIAVASYDYNNNILYLGTTSTSILEKLLDELLKLPYTLQEELNELIEKIQVNNMYLVIGGRIYSIRGLKLVTDITDAVKNQLLNEYSDALIGKIRALSSVSLKIHQNVLKLRFDDQKLEIYFMPRNIQVRHATFKGMLVELHPNYTPVVLAFPAIVYSGNEPFYATISFFSTKNCYPVPEICNRLPNMYEYAKINENFDIYIARVCTKLKLPKSKHQIPVMLTKHYESLSVVDLDSAFFNDQWIDLFKGKTTSSGSWFNN